LILNLLINICYKNGEFLIMSKTAKKPILIRGFGNSGAGAVIEAFEDK